MKAQKLLSITTAIFLSLSLITLITPLNLNAQEGASDTPKSEDLVEVTPLPLESQAAGPIIIDHTCTDLSKIPDYWLEEAKKLSIHYAHTSHGSQINSGLAKLEQVDSKYSFHRFSAGSTPPSTLPCSSGELCMYDGNPPETYIEPGDYWSTTDGINRTQAVAGTNLFNYSMWSWCGQQSTNSTTTVQSYLDTMTQFETNHPGMRFILMTGHTDTASNRATLERNNNMVRQYALDNNMVLFDFADIESYDPLGGGPYYINPDGNCSWCENFCNNHPQYCANLPNDCAHTNSPVENRLFCKLKGNAFWWMMARLAGWNGVSTAGNNTAPNTPANPNPAHQAPNVFYKSSLRWQGGDADGNPVTYTVAFGPSSSPPIVGTVTQPLYSPPMHTNTTYYWAITATDGISSSAGPVWQFTTSTVTTPTLYLPLIAKNSAGSTPAGASPQIAGCDVFPADNIWNTPINTMPVHPNSAAYITTMGASTRLHADFGSGTWEGSPIGIPYLDVPGTQPLVNVSFYYPGESDAGPYPIPANAPIEGGPDSDGDRHVLVLNRDNCTLYEMFDAWPQPDGSWEAGSGAVFDLSSHALRPDGWTSADAAGLPILPGLVRYDEVAAGEIRHAIRFTAPQTRRAYVWPARHYASSLTGQQYPPMGQRFRLKASFNISGFSPQMQVILQAMKTYGIILADNGSRWYISGVPDERWNNDLLRNTFNLVHGSDFEAVDVSSLMINSASGQARQ